MPSLKLVLWILVLLSQPRSMVGQSEPERVRLIVRLDDLGCSQATHEGIKRTIEEGIASSVEVMVPTPWYPMAVDYLRKNPHMDVGVHLTLTSEWTNLKWRPLTHVPSLTDPDGYFYAMVRSNSQLPGQAIMDHQWSLSEIEQELRAQIEKAKRDFHGLSHLSAHMGCLSINEETSALFRRLAKDYGLDIFPEDYGVKRFPGIGQRSLAVKERIQIFKDNLKNLTPGNWLFVEHPALDTPEQRAIGHPGYEDVAKDRQDVVDVLTDPGVKKLIHELQIEIISYLDLLK